jgi:phosphatidyl-myo-inositol dimannoside synthase
VKILYVSHSFPPRGRALDNLGGMQRVATELHAALRAHPGVRLSGLLLETSWRWTHVRTPFFLLRLLREIPRLAREEGIEVVLFSSMVTASIAPALRRRMGGGAPLLAAIPVGRDLTLPVGVYQRLVPRVLDALDVVLPISRATAAEALDRGAAPERTRVVPCGVDLSRFGGVDRAAARVALLERGGGRIPADALLLASVGRHQERKGFHWFAERVMPRLPRAHYLVGGEGPFTGKIREAAARAGVSERVHLLGRLSEEALVELYGGSDLFVMPNIPVPGDMEGFGVVMLEAGMGGLPTVAADLEGIRDVVCEGENGVLVPSGDAQAFAGAIGDLTASRAGLAESSRRAADFTASTFSWSGIVDRMLEIFSSRPESDTVRAPAPAERTGPPASEA